MGGTGAACSIGIDVGGTKIAGGIVLASTGELREIRRVLTRPERGGAVVLAEATELARSLAAVAAEQALDVRGVGVGVAELVDLDGRVVSAHTIPWIGVPVRESFERIAPTVIDADSRAAAMGEAAFGAGRSYTSFLYVTVGTGIGSAFVADGKPFRGARGLTGTLASGPTTIECASCGQLSSRVLEEFASGPALVRRFARRSAREAKSAEDVLAHAAAGDDAAIDIVRSAATALGSTVGLLVSVLDPAAVVVGGGLGSAAGLYWDTFEPAARAHIWSGLHRALPIVQAAQGANAGVVGAAALTGVRPLLSQ